MLLDIISGGIRNGQLATMSDKAIHIYNPKKDLVRVDGMVWRSGTWIVNWNRANQLIGKYIYLHSAKAKASFFGGVITSVEKGPRHSKVESGEGIQEGVVFYFEATPEGKNSAWYGSKSTQQVISFVPEAELS